MSTSVLKALPGKFDIKRQSPSILHDFGIIPLSSNIPFGITKSIKLKLEFHMETPQDLLTNVCSNRPDNMTNWRPHPNMVKHLPKILSKSSEGRQHWDMVCILEGPEGYFGQIIKLLGNN